MTNNMHELDNYTSAIEALPEKAFLGSLVFFSISSADVHLTNARQELIDAGLPIDGLRKNLRPIDAYSKATKLFAHKLDMRAESSGGIRREFLVRALGEDEEEVIREVVLERAVINPTTGQQRQLYYEPVARLYLVRGVKKQGVYTGHSVYAEQKMGIVRDQMSDAERLHLDTMLGRFPDRFDHLLNYMDSHAVRTYVRTVIEKLDGVLVKESGGLYFIAQEHVEKLNALQAWVRQIGSEFHSLPLLNLADQRQMIVEALEEETVTEVARMMRDIKDILADPERVIEQRTFDAYGLRGAELAARVDEYASMLGARATDAETQIKIFTGQLMALTGRIKGHRPVATRSAG